jgi:hypothetical protein
MATREEIATALLAKLAATGAFVMYGRRLLGPESIPQNQTPALCLVDANELYESQARNLPSKRMLMLDAIVYVDVGSDVNAVPATPLNNALDAIDTALKADSGQGFCTLGGKVHSAKITGEVQKAPGDVTGKGLAIVPIEVLIP